MPNSSSGFAGAEWSERPNRKLLREVELHRDDGTLDATLYFYGMPGEDEVLELTFNHDGSTCDLGTG